MDSTTSYDYNTSDKELKNPYVIENIFLFAGAIIQIIAGIVLVYLARGFVLEEKDKLAVMVSLFALAILGVAVKLLIRAFSQIRFFFGRSYPKNLCDLNSAGTTEIINSLKTQSIAFVEPDGPLSGVIYNWVKPLVTCPPPLQVAAIQYFHSLFGMSAILISMLVSWFLFSGQPHEGIISWSYLPLTGLSIIAPFIKGNSSYQISMTSIRGNAGIMIWKLLALVIFAIGAPALVSRFVPALPIPPMWIAPALLLIGSMVAMILFLRSLLYQTDNIHTKVSNTQREITMNCHPSQIWTKVKRDFQNVWTNGIPNRAYSEKTPETTGDRGHFAGELMEETHPLLASSMHYPTLRDAWHDRQGRFLIILECWAVLLSLAAVITAVSFTTKFPDMSRMEISRIIVTVFGLNFASVFAFRVGHLLWSKMSFLSRLVFLSLDGSFQVAEMRIGNQWRGNVQSRATLTRIENASLRIWMCDIRTIAFGKDGQRFIMSMESVDHDMEKMSDGLINFALNQSSIATPTSDIDLKKTDLLAKMDRMYELQRKQADRELKSTEPYKQIATGKIKFFNREKNYGFIETNHKDIYFNGRDLQNADIKPGQRVQFLLTHGESRKGPVAKEIVSL